MSDREAMRLALEALEWAWGGEPMGTKEQAAMQALRAALAAPRPEPVRHPGYVIGSHWLETAYSRVCAGEAEADVLRDIGLVREEAFLTGVAHLKAENEALRRDAEQFRWMRENAISVDTVADPDGLVQVWVGTDPAKCFYGRTLDAAIVSAMAGSET